jgi:hypothetical protein
MRLASAWVPDRSIKKELSFVNEGYFTPRELKVVPTYASVPLGARPPDHRRQPRVMVVDGERGLSLQAAAGGRGITRGLKCYGRVRQGRNGARCA